MNINYFKDIIRNYYNLENVEIHKMNNSLYILSKKSEYYFENLLISEIELNEIYTLNLARYGYYSFIKNVNNELITKINDKQYVLMKKNTKNYTNIQLHVNNNKKILNRSNWPKLWENKIDYFEYQLTHIEDKYPKISETIDYFIGMSENAIIYVKETMKTEKLEFNDNLCISHKRIDSYNYYNPLNIVFDHKARDASEYLKYIFLSNKYKNVNLKKIIKNFNFSRYGYRLLYGRMYFPSQYFDYYERIINDNSNEKIIKSIINKTKEYELYLDKIYYYINSIVKIPKIIW